MKKSTLLILLLLTNNALFSQVDFDSLISGYPFAKYTEDKDLDRYWLYKDILKGDWPQLHDKYINTCAIRMSIALNKYGEDLKITKGYKSNHFDGSGKRILTSVLDMEKHLRAKLGEPWGVSKEVGKPFPKKYFPKFKGIVLYKFKYQDANGHVDLWNGQDCLYDCPVPNIEDSAEIMIWKLE